MSVKNQARQGDVLLTRVESLPREAQPAEGLVLALGEATGHAHRVEAVEGVSRFEAEEIHDSVSRRIQYLVNKTNREVQLLHEEHRTIMIPPGIWRIVLQEEYAPREYRRVAD